MRARASRLANWRVFVWTKERGIEDLGALEGYPLSQALGINEKRQVVGTSCTADFTECRAVIWVRGKIVDLNDLAPGFSDLLYSANDINDRGEIAGQAFTPGAERYAAVWALPIRQHRDNDATADLEATSRRAPLPQAIRASFLQRFGSSRHSNGL